MASQNLSWQPAFNPVAVLCAEARQHVETGPVTVSCPGDRDEIVAHLADARCPARKVTEPAAA